MCAAKSLFFSSKDELKRSYNECKPILSLLLTAIENDIKKNITLVSMPSYKSRVKDFKSYYRKLLRLRPLSLGNQSLPIVTDLVGIRVICAFLEDITLVEQQISEYLKVIEIERKGASRTFSDFGYESIHILISMDQEFLATHLSPEHITQIPNDLVCEIQLRTILQDAWAEVEHELVYKSEFSPFDLPLRRKLASMNASLSLADIIFQEIRDYQNKLNSELDQRRVAFFDQADVLSSGKLDADDQITKSSPLFKNIGTGSPYVKGTIDDMLLDAINAHNNGSLDKAIAIYSRILNVTPLPNNVILSVIYKHRGMAFFAQNKYEDAKKDFLSSSEHDPNNFRAFYYVGIVCSVLNNEESALEYFDRSLESNGYQPHVYYRKALSLFHLNLFSLAFENLTIATDLGLDSEESARLRQLLQTKLDNQQPI